MGVVSGDAELYVKITQGKMSHYVFNLYVCAQHIFHVYAGHHAQYLCAAVRDFGVICVIGKCSNG